MKNPSVWWGLLTVTLLGITTAYIRESRARRSGPEIPVLGQVHDFTLHDQHNQPVTRLDLKGKTWIADFIYTSCPDQCPRMSRNMAHIQSLLPEKANVQLLSISVDPDHDKPDVLSAYARRFKADSRWRFVTGQRSTVRALAENFKLVPPESAAGNLIDHSNRLVMVDARSRIRGYYDGTDEKEVQRLIKDVSQVAGETVQ